MRCASDVRLVNISSVNACRAKGTGFVGSGWVLAATSPGVVLASYLRYLIGKRGLP